MASPYSLAIPGAGSMAEVLSRFNKLGDGMNETKRACKRLHSRLEVVFMTLQKMKLDDSQPIRDRTVDVVSKFLQFLTRYHGKDLVHRVVEHSTMMDQLRHLHEEVAVLFELLNIVPTGNWGDEWEDDLQLQMEVLTATVKSCAVVRSELQDPRDRAEALLLLKFEIEQRGERNDDDVLGLMKSMLATVLVTSNTAEEALPTWFLPLYELEFESKPFARRSIGTLHRGVWGDQTNVTIKFFLVDNEVLDERMQRQLEKELDAITTLSHPNVVRMLGASHISLPPFIVYEFASNGNLSAFLAQSDRNKQQMWRLLYEAALGLRHIHDRNIVHGNLKLSNILVDGEGRAKLSDVGLLRMRTCSTLSQAKHEGGSTSNNLRWRAPECLRRRPTFASDIYSFAMCIIEAVLGEPPFAFLSDDDVRDNLRKGEIPDKPEEMTHEMWELVQAMTNFEPAKRLGINAVLARLKGFAAEAADGQLSVESTSHDSTVEIRDENHPSLEEHRSVSGLLTALRCASGQDQETLMQQLVEECAGDEQRSLLFESKGVASLSELIASGSHCTQVGALLVLSWISNLDMNVSKQDLEAHRMAIRAATPPEQLEATKAILQHQDKVKAAIYCAGLGTVMKGKPLRDPALVAALVDLLRNENDAVKLWATIAVGKLANNDVDRTILATKGAIAPLLVLLQVGTQPQKLWASYALAKLCQDNEANSVAIASSGAIPLLMVLLQDGIDRQKEFAALALGHLAFASDNSCSLIASAGAVALLVSLLRSGSGRQKERAGFALGSLMSRSIDNCTAIEVDGGVELLVSLLINGTDAQKESSAFALGTFVARGDVKSNAAELEEATSSS